jgi:hypothetical protein
MIRMFIDLYLLLGAEEEVAYYTHPSVSKKPNIIYRIYKIFNRRFRNEMSAYVQSLAPEKKHDKRNYIFSRIKEGKS